MRNDLKLHHFGRLKMYAHRSTPTHVLQDVMSLWMDLTYNDLDIIAKTCNHEPSRLRAFEARNNENLLKSNFEHAAKTAQWTYVVYFGETPVAFMTVGPNDNVSALFVREDARGLGIGSYLICNHLEIFKKNLTIAVVKGNTKATELYIRLGFYIHQEDMVYAKLLHPNLD